MALDAAGIAQMDSWRDFTIHCDYGFYERLKRILEDFEAVLRSTDFAADVVSEVLIRSDRAAAFYEKLTDTSAGKAVCEKGEESFLGVRVR